MCLANTNYHVKICKMSFEKFEDEKVAIVHDSATSLPDEYRIGYPGLAEVPFKIVAVTDDRSKTWIDNPFESEKERQEFLYNLKNGQLLTSQPNPADYEQIFSEIIASGITEIGVIPMSNGPGMSGSRNSAESAAKDLEKVANIRVFDSKTLSVGQGLLVAQADAENKNGEFETADDLVNRVEELSKGLYLAQGFSDLGHLRRGGRIGLAASMVGGVFDIVPVLSLNEDGVLYPLAKKRHWKRAHAAIVEHVFEGLESYTTERELGSIAVRFAFVDFESTQIENLRSVAAARIRKETKDTEESEPKIHLAKDKDGKPYKIIKGKESKVLATHTSVGVAGFAGLVVSERHAA